MKKARKDVLDALLELSGWRVGLGVKCTMGGTWQLAHPQTQGQAVLHIVTTGHSIVTLAEGMQRLQSGEALLLTRGDAHQLGSSNIDANGISIYSGSNETGGFTIKRIGDRVECEILCLNYHYQSQLIYSLLPNSIHISFKDNKTLSTLIDLLKEEVDGHERDISEIKRASFGKLSLVNALAQAIFIEILRVGVNQKESPLLYLLCNRQNTDNKHIENKYFQRGARFGELLSDIIQEPEHQWTLEEMAMAIYTSRSGLIRLFKNFLNTSPHSFLLNVRLQKSAQLLKHSSLSIEVIAYSVGFKSVAHFSQAFKRHYNLSPSQYRSQ